MIVETSYVAILDVGHGNSTVVVDHDRVVIIDTGLKNGLIDYLIEQNIYSIDLIILSHADADHIGGLIAILSRGTFEIREVRLNADGRKSTKIWDYLAYELDQLNRKGQISFIPTLTTNDTGTLDGPTIQVEVLAPSPYLVTKGVGNTLRSGKRVETNTISAVVRLNSLSGPIALLPGDIDATGLDEMLSVYPSLRASVLVFPHHGGQPGYSSDAIGFTEKLCAAVQPLYVVFSIDRNRSNLLPEIVNTVKQHVQEVKIACTQLSSRCSTVIPDHKPPHLNDVFAMGLEKNHCCAGTILVYFSQSTQVTPIAHSQFVQNFVPQGLCR